MKALRQLKVAACDHLIRIDLMDTTARKPQGSDTGKRQHDAAVEVAVAEGEGERNIERLQVQLANNLGSLEANAAGMNADAFALPREELAEEFSPYGPLFPPGGSLGRVSCVLGVGSERSADMTRIDVDY